MKECSYPAFFFFSDQSWKLSKTVANSNFLKSGLPLCCAEVCLSFSNRMREVFLKMQVNGLLSMRMGSKLEKNSSSQPQNHQHKPEVTKSITSDDGQPSSSKCTGVESTSSQHVGPNQQSYRQSTHTGQRVHTQDTKKQSST